MLDTFALIPAVVFVEGMQFNCGVVFDTLEDFEPQFKCCYVVTFVCKQFCLFHNVTPLYQEVTQTPKTTGQTHRNGGQQRGGQTTPTNPHGTHQAGQRRTHSTNDRNEEHPKDGKQDEERPRSRQHAEHEPPGTEEQGRATARSQARATKSKAHAPSGEEQQQSARRKPTQETPPKKFGFPTAQQSRVVLAQPGLTLDCCAIQYLFFLGVFVVLASCVLLFDVWCALFLVGFLYRCALGLSAVCGFLYRFGFGLYPL